MKILIVLNNNIHEDYLEGEVRVRVRVRAWGEDEGGMTQTVGNVHSRHTTE
jgi:hypothetical protein